MAPMYGYPNYEFSDEEDWGERDDFEENPPKLTEMAFWYMIILIVMLLLWLFMFFCLRIIALSKYYFISLYSILFYMYINVS